MTLHTSQGSLLLPDPAQRHCCLDPQRHSKAAASSATKCTVPVITWKWMKLKSKCHSGSMHWCWIPALTENRPLWLCWDIHQPPSSHLTRRHHYTAGRAPWQCPGASEILGNFWGKKEDKVSQPRRVPKERKTKMKGRCTGLRRILQILILGASHSSEQHSTTEELRDSLFSNLKRLERGQGEGTGQHQFTSSITQCLWSSTRSYLSTDECD